MRLVKTAFLLSLSFAHHDSMRQAMRAVAEDGGGAEEEVVGDLVEQLKERAPSLKNVKMIQTFLLNAMVNRMQKLKG